MNDTSLRADAENGANSAPLVHSPPSVVARAPADRALAPFVPNGHARGTTSGRATEDELNPTELLRIMRRRWKVALPIFLLAVGIAWWRYTQQTPLYEAVTTIRLDKNKESIPGMGFPVIGMEQKGLSTEIQVIQSRGVANEVAKRFAYAVQVATPHVARSLLLDSIRLSSMTRSGRYTLQGNQNGRVTATGPDSNIVTGKAGQWLSVGGLSFVPTTFLASQKQVVLEVLNDNASTDALRKVLKVTQPVRDAQVLRLTVRDGDPELAARLSDGVAEAFTASQSSRRQVGGRTTVAFIRAQLDSLDLQLRLAEVQLRDWRSEQRVVVPGAEAGTAVARTAEYEARVAEKRLELDYVQSLIAGQSTKGSTAAGPAAGVIDPAAMRRVLSSPIMKQNLVATSILTNLLQLESQRAQLLTRRTRADPDVKLMDETIADYEQQGQVLANSYVESLRSEIAGVERGIGQLETRLARFPGQELALTTLQRNTEVLAALQTTLRTRLKEAEITNASDDPTVEILDRAVPPTKRVSPLLSVYAGAGIMTGLLLAVLAAVGRDRMDRTIHSREDIERATGASLIGLIPSFTTGQTSLSKFRERRRMSNVSNPVSKVAVTSPTRTSGAMAGGQDIIAVNSPRHVAAEAYRMLRTNLRFAPVDQPRHVLTVSSPSPGDGKSTTALNLAATVAVQGKKVLLIDGDMRRGTLHQKLGMARSPGLSGLLAGRVKFDEAIRTVQLGDGVAIDLIACGDAPPNPAELIGGSSMAALVSWARSEYETVIIDTPPVNMFADGLLLAAASDAMILIGRAGKSFRVELAVAADQLRSVNVPIAGVVLNDFDRSRDGRYGGYYYYDRYYYKYYASYAADGENGSAA